MKLESRLSKAVLKELLRNSWTFHTAYQNGNSLTKGELIMNLELKASVAREF